jgi:hypothetical protein
MVPRSRTRPDIGFENTAISSTRRKSHDAFPVRGSFVVGQEPAVSPVVSDRSGEGHQPGQCADTKVRM